MLFLTFLYELAEMGMKVSYKNPFSFEKGQKGTFLKYKLNNTYAQFFFFSFSFYKT